MYDFIKSKGHASPSLCNLNQATCNNNVYFLWNFRIIFGSSFSMTINKDTVEQGRYLQEKLVEKGFHIGM